MSELSRRKLIRSGLTAAAGATGVALGAAVADRNGLIPPNWRGVYGLGETLTYASHRLLAAGANAREFPRSEISPKPFANGSPPTSDDFLKHQEQGFADWRLSVDGLVERPGSLSLDEIRGYPAESQITQLACEEGWNFIAEWTGTPLSHVLELVGIRPEARFIFYTSIQPGWKGLIEMDDALHPQTLVTYGFNGGDLPIGHGGPLRLRVPRQLGYKSIKYLTGLTAIDSVDPSLLRSSYSWYAGI